MAKVCPMVHCNKYQISRLNVLHNTVARYGGIKATTTLTFQRIIVCHKLADYFLFVLFTYW